MTKTPVNILLQDGNSRFLEGERQKGPDEERSTDIASRRGNQENGSKGALNVKTWWEMK